MRKTNWLGLWRQREGLYSGYPIDKKDIPNKTYPILRFNKYYKPNSGRPYFVYCFADASTHKRLTETISFEEWQSSDRERVVRLEDAIEVARSLLRDADYGYSYDDLSVEVVGFMEAESVCAVIDKEVQL